MRAPWWIEDAEEVTVLKEVRSAWPFFLYFWYCSHHDSRELALREKGLVDELGLVL